MSVSDDFDVRRSQQRAEREQQRVATRRVRRPRQHRKPRVRDAPEGVRPELWEKPRPLLSDAAQLAVLWSPKSGCSFVSKWFFSQLDIEIDGWVHVQRRDFQASVESVASAVAFSNDPSTFRKLRVARDPYDRAVSSYMHYLSQVSKRNPSIERDRMEVWSGRTELSFREFVSGLLSTDSSLVNVHWRPQIHPLERAGLFDDSTIVKLEDSIDELPRFEKANGLAATDLGALRSSHHDASKDTELDVFVGDTPFVGDVRKRSPRYDLFYDQALLDDVYELYRDDFERFGYRKRVAAPIER